MSEPGTGDHRAETRPPAAASAPQIWITAAWMIGLLLRLHAASALPRQLYGDEPWYAGTAQAAVAGAAPALDPFIRPPGTTWWIAAVFSVGGAGNLALVGVANAWLNSLNVPILAAIGRFAAPQTRWLPPLVAWTQALNPFEIVHSAAIASEALYIPLTLLLVLLCLRAAQSPSWGRAAAAGLCAGALLHVRTDVAPGVVAAMAVGAVLARRGGATWRTALTRFGAALGLTIVLCVPWSIQASRDRGRPVFVADQASNPWTVERRGWWTWISNLSMRRTEWLQLYWRGPGGFIPGTLPRDAFRSDEEAAAVEALLARARAARANLPDVDAAFRRLGEERIAQEPLRFHVLLPLERAARIWLDPTDSDVPPEQREGVPGPVQLALLGWRMAWRTLLGAGFLVAAVTWRSATPRGLVALLVLLRTLVLVAGFPLFGHGAKFESRNVANVEPLALVVLATAVAQSRSVRRRQSYGV